MPAHPADRFAELSAPAGWQAVDFISDLHLQSGEPGTFAALRRYLESPPQPPADALFILGDMFEVWVGDDVLDAGIASSDEHRFQRDCATALLAHSRHTPVFFMSGNRDFLLGPGALEACGMQALADPSVLVFHGHRWMLSHGDALCLDDTDYMQFRAQVRQASWQSEFLAQPLAQREAVARELRSQSEARKMRTGSDPALWADVDPSAARNWLQQANAHTLIHGHTHRPAEHALGDGLRRVVLSDWDADATPPRAELLRLDAQGLHRLPLP
jgi:UDP-2,3-diacylglucosamine hydrolase